MIGFICNALYLPCTFAAHILIKNELSVLIWHSKILTTNNTNVKQLTYEIF